jgi:hypothetical protein
MQSRRMVLEMIVGWRDFMNEASVSLRGRLDPKVLS